MLSDPETIDMMTPIPPDALLMAVMDFHPWPDPDSEERFQQYHRKLDGYCRYVVSKKFSADHPNVDRTKLIISVVATVTLSERMRQTRAVYTPSDPSFEILVRIADESNVGPGAVTAPRKRPWWKFWG